MFGNQFGAGVYPVYLLDLFPSSDVGFSLRKLRNNYTGPCIRVTRTSDNATKDIFFGAYSIDTIDLLDFVGASDGRVNIWYDQSGNGFDVSEGTVANQPLIVESGVLVTSFGLPTIKFISATPLRLSRTTGSNILRNSPGAGMFTVSENTGPGTASQQIVAVRQLNTGTRLGISMRVSAAVPGYAAGGRRLNTDTFVTVGGNPFTNDRILGSTVINYTNRNLNNFQNGVPAGVSTTFGNAGGNTGDTEQQLYIGQFNLTSTPYQGFISEVVLWAVNQADNRLGIEANINAYYQIYTLIETQDVDAYAFINAAGITNPIEQLAINNLVIDLKDAGLWTKMNAIYPYVGGTATTHKFNLKNPADTDAAFRLAFSGTITHNTNGVTGNGSTGFANTFINVANDLGGGRDDASGFVYSITNSQSGVDFGVLDTNGFQLNIRNTSNQLTARCNTAAIITPSNSNSIGFFGISRLSSTEYSRNINKSHTTVSAAATSAVSRAIFVLALNNVGTAAFFSARNIAFQCFGKGLTTTEIDTLVDINGTFQTTLGRFVG